MQAFSVASVSVILGLTASPCYAAVSDATARSITGSNDTRSITGSNDTRSITGSNGTRSLVVRDPARANGLFDSVAVGPIESIAIQGGRTQVAVLGQSYAAPAALAERFAPGDYVIVQAHEGVLGAIRGVDEPYLAGSSPVDLLGVITSVDPRRGTLAVNGVTVDYSAYLVSDPGFEPRANEFIHVSGIQPTTGGIIIATERR